MTAKEKEVYQQYRDLNRAGWNIDNTTSSIRFNGGSESLHHILAKSVAAKVCLDTGYRVASEVETDDGDECDILAYGHESRKPIVIELENGLTERTRKKKLNQYLVGDVREVYVIGLDAAPDGPESLYDHIGDVTGLIV